MSVFTPLQKPEIKAVVEQYGLGTLISFEGVEEGVENSNFFVTTLDSSSGNKLNEYVLTLFETLEKKDLDFFIDLQKHLARQNLPVPNPVKDKDGNYLIEVKGKPALLAPRLKGRHPKKPSLEQCEVIGSTLATIHLSSEKFPLTRKNDFDIRWMSVANHRLKPFLESDETELIANELQLFRNYDRLGFKLPTSIVHGDLFRDNTLFQGSKLTGILDLYNACNYYSCFDLAVCINDWCKLSDIEIDELAMQAMVESYKKLRNFTQEEKEIWPIMLRFAACRFWLSRLMAKHFAPATPQKEAMIKAKDPTEYKNLLIHLQDNSYHL